MNEDAGYMSATCTRTNVIVCAGLLSMDAIGAFSLLSLANSSSDKAYVKSFSGYKNCNVNVKYSMYTFNSDKRINTFLMLSYNIGISAAHMSSQLISGDAMYVYPSNGRETTRSTSYKNGNSTYILMLYITCDTSSIEISISYSNGGGSAQVPNSNGIYYSIFGICFFE